MMDNWETIKLGNAIEYQNDFINIDDLLKYKLCRVQTKAQGVILREEKQGFEIKTKKQQVCKTDDLIFAEMDARFGGYGITSQYFIDILNRLANISPNAPDKVFIDLLPHRWPKLE